MATNVLGGLALEPFSDTNIEELHGFFESQAGAGLYSFPLDTFKRVTVNDADFDPDYSIVARDSDTKEIVSAFLAVARSAWISLKGKFLTFSSPVITMFAVHEKRRRKGVGSAVLSLLLARLKAGKWPSKERKKGPMIRIMKAYLMAAPPNYIWPGLDPRYTAAFFFLKGNGFKRSGERQNLVYRIPAGISEPPSVLGEYHVTRATRAELNPTIDFIKQHHPGIWPTETGLAFENDPATAFIVKDPAGKVVGFAAHSITFPGSFGPTGVLESLRGKGIGGTLLRWCAYDLKQSGIDEMIIRWVGGDTMKFYSKSIGAHVHQVYWTMHRRL